MGDWIQGFVEIVCDRNILQASPKEEFQPSSPLDCYEKNLRSESD